MKNEYAYHTQYLDFNKTINAGAYTSGAVSLSELDVPVNSIVVFGMMHPTKLESNIQQGLFLSYTTKIGKITSSSEAVISFTIFNSTSTQRTESYRAYVMYRLNPYSE